MGDQRILLVLGAKRAFLHADALGVTYAMPPHIRKTGKCWRPKKCMYGTLPAAAGWQKVASATEAMKRSGARPRRVRSPRERETYCPRGMETTPSKQNPRETSIGSTE